MTKVIKKHIKKAIIIYEDPDLKEGRRVVFGEISEVLDLLISQMPIIFKRIQKMSEKDFKTPQEMIDWYLENKEDWAKLHGIKASDNMELELTYEVKKL